ncbi:MAG TPA: hypothetical protein VG271_18420, partial [Beijerinckiaceae bacterium]|nr:hypothetical protein [Beijerinckiaceae bacterium]
MFATMTSMCTLPLLSRHAACFALMRGSISVAFGGSRPRVRAGVARFISKEPPIRPTSSIQLGDFLWHRTSTAGFITSAWGARAP